MFWLLLLSRLGRLLFLRRWGCEEGIDLFLECLKSDLNLIDGVPDVLMELLGSENLLNHIEQRAHLSDLSEDLLAVVLVDGSATLVGELVINFLSEISKLLLVNREVVTEVESSLDWVGKLLELIKSLLVCGMRGRLALTVDPVNSVLKFFHISNTEAFFNILLHRSVCVNVILNLVSE